MLTLALETSGPLSSVAVVSDGRVLGEVSLAGTETHSRRLIPTVVWLLERLGCEWPDLGLIAVSLGPGSFTGLRIGLSAAKGFSFALRIPLVGVPTLDALASQVPAWDTDLVCPMMHARKSEIYMALYRGSEKGVAERMSPYRVVRPAEVAAFVPYGQRVTLLGDALFLHGTAVIKALGGRGRTISSQISHARAASVGLLAGGRLQAGGNPDDLVGLKPIYVLPSEAEARRAERNEGGGDRS